ncbi:MAG TPA: TetR/AcrR family transcriptional regulator [Planctomycetes bacterium]|nr:TetR/AcrR family transcriptional regulator [Planctomycetota bacterium]
MGDSEKTCGSGPGGKSTPSARTRILDAAERIFAEQGVDAASLRRITREAEANIAGVHYYFGSKNGLVLEVYRRLIRPVNKKRLSLLDQARASAGEDPIPLPELVKIFFIPPLLICYQEHCARPHLPRLIGRMFSDAPDLIRKMIDEEFSKMKTRFLEELGMSLGRRPKEELIWKLHFMVGILVNTMLATEFPPLSLLDHHPAEKPAQSLRQILAFALAGIQQDPESLDLSMDDFESYRVDEAVFGEAE